MENVKNALRACPPYALFLTGLSGAVAYAAYRLLALLATATGTA